MIPTDELARPREPKAAPRPFHLLAKPTGAVCSGRNELCPCESGRKWKHCHGAEA